MMDVSGEAASLLRSLRTRAAAVPGVSEREEPKAIVFVHSGSELARVVLKAGSYPRFALEGEDPKEIRGLADCAAAIEKVRLLAQARAARLPQLDLF
jgi:hypothetical protein